jgi:hypothetical protein
MDKSSAETAFNNIAGVTAFAELNEISPAELFKQMADASEEILKYSNMTTSQYANQAVLLSNMNTSMKDMAAASGTMVLNYKDSIKSEMSLSAMLGKNVNLSEVRARLMSGDMAGGASALKSALGGIDIGSMNAFQKQALSQSTGMGIEQLMELTQSKGGGAKGTLSEKAGIKTGQDIAKGARQMDIATKKELLSMEQGQRLHMLEIEHQFRLKQIEKEEEYKILWERDHAPEQQKNMAAAKIQAEAYAKIGAYSGDISKQAFAASGLSAGTAGMGGKSEAAAQAEIKRQNRLAEIDKEIRKGAEEYSVFAEIFNTKGNAKNQQILDTKQKLEQERVSLQKTGGASVSGGQYITPIVKDTATNTNQTAKNTQLQVQQMDDLTAIETNGYSELLKRVDVTNELMSQLIDTTWAGAGQQIHMDGTRVGKVLKSISNRNYGIGVTTSTAMGH